MSNDSQKAWEQGKNDAVQRRDADPSIYNAPAIIREKYFEGREDGNKQNDQKSS
jgi:hypothetical protein